MANWVADLKQFCSEKNEKDSFQGIETFYSMDAKLGDNLRIWGQLATICQVLNTPAGIQVRRNFQAIGWHWMISD